MKKETSFNLSEYIADGQRGKYVYVDFVKESIIKLKELIEDEDFGILLTERQADRMSYALSKVFGKELMENSEEIRA
jgi:hypothetical protein